MRIINLNPDTAIGATAWFVEMEGHRLLMDAGTHPRLEGRAALPLYDLIKARGAGRHRHLPLPPRSCRVAAGRRCATFPRPMS